jgi:hypothetical protein
VNLVACLHFFAEMLSDVNSCRLISTACCSLEDVQSHLKWFRNVTTLVGCSRNTAVTRNANVLV